MLHNNWIKHHKTLKKLTTCYVTARASSLSQKLISRVSTLPERNAVLSSCQSSLLYKQTSATVITLPNKSF